MINTHITFIGGGNMGRALIKGLLANVLSAQQVTVVEANLDTAKALEADFQINMLPGIEAVNLDPKRNNIVVMAIKPQDFSVAADTLRPKLKQVTDIAPLVLSIAAGIRLADMSRWLDHACCVRAMPNTPALIGKGITGLFADQSVNQESRALAQAVCEAVGQTVWVSDETLMDAVTAVSGSGPAYVFAFLEAMQASGEKLGLDVQTSRKLAYATIEGAAQLALNSSESASILRERVTSKGGTTAAALQVLQEQHWQSILEQAIAAANQRGKVMGDELGNAS